MLQGRRDPSARYYTSKVLTVCTTLGIDIVH